MPAEHYASNVELPLNFGTPGFVLFTEFLGEFRIYALPLPDRASRCAGLFMLFVVAASDSLCLLAVRD